MQYTVVHGLYMYTDTHTLVRSVEVMSTQSIFIWHFNRLHLELMSTVNVHKSNQIKMWVITIYNAQPMHTFQMNERFMAIWFLFKIKWFQSIESPFLHFHEHKEMVYIFLLSSLHLTKLIVINQTLMQNRVVSRRERTAFHFVLMKTTIYCFDVRYKLWKMGISTQNYDLVFWSDCLNFQSEKRKRMLHLKIPDKSKSFGLC